MTSTRMNIVRGHIPFLLLESGNPVGTVRFDLESEGHAVVRLVAVLPARQRRGLGRAMMAALENVAIEKGVRRLKVHSAPGVESCGLLEGFRRHRNQAIKNPGEHKCEHEEEDEEGDLHPESLK